MISNNFRRNIVLRLLLAIALGTASLHLIVQTAYWMAGFWLLLFMIFAVLSLLRYIERNYTALGNFLEGVRYSDFSSLGNIRKKTQNKGLSKAFHHIADLIENLRIEAESNYQYLHTVVNHVNVGIVCFDTTGRINLLNDAARDFFQMNRVHDISSFKPVAPKFLELLEAILPGERKLLTLELRGYSYQLAVTATSFKREEKEYKLVSFQNIKGELEQKEMESWYRLTRVLTHEIMNSAIPIANLSEMVSETILDDKGGFRDLNQLEAGEKEELTDSLRTISSRSQGLVNFVNSTRSITRLAPPKLNTVDMVALVEGIFALFNQKLRECGIHYEVVAPEEQVYFQADAGQLEQVFINLLQNAIDATLNTPSPFIRAMIEQPERDQLLVSIEDNGAGMKPGEKEQVFVPFYTTKKQGSGIGLSLSRHIIFNHRGQIAVKSEEGKGTRFEILFFLS